MATGNHLTVRDYFDQVLVGRSARRNDLSPHKLDGYCNRTFHQILAAHGNRRLDQNNLKPTGLTVVDYLKNPVRVKCQFNHQPALTSSEKKETKMDTAPTSPTGKPDEDNKAKSTSLSGGNRKSRQTIPPSASTSSPKQTGSNDKLIIEKSIRKAARKYDLPTDLIRGVIKAESNFQVNAVSSAGAQGLMQLMPGTAKELGVDNPFDIEQNIDGGACYLRKMLDSFDGDIKVALAAYNAGPGAVEKYGGNVPPYQETERYIDRVLKFSKQVT